MGDVMTGKRKLEAAIARMKKGVGFLLMLLILFYVIALGMACLVGIVLFLLWISSVLLSIRI